MAKYERRFRGNFDTVLNQLHREILNGKIGRAHV